MKKTLKMLAVLAMLIIVVVFYYTKVDRLKSLDVEDFIFTVSENGSKDKQVEMMTSYVSSRFSTNEMRSQNIKSNNVNKRIVKITYYIGWFDDSIDKTIYIVEFKLKDKTWFIKSVQTGWKCHEGRGHQNYTNEACN